MKKYFLFCLLFSISTLVCSQPIITLSKTLGGAGYEQIQDLVSDEFGHVFALCSADSVDGDVICTMHGMSDVWLVKMDEDANILWQHCYGGSDIEKPHQIISTSDGGFLFTSETKSNDGDVTGNHGAGDIWIVKIDSAGEIQWQKCIGGGGGEAPNDCLQLSNGKYLLCCSSVSASGDFPVHYGSGFSTDPWIVILESNGNIDTALHFGGSDDDEIEQVIELPNKEWQMVGRTLSDDYDLAGTTSFGNFDAWIIRTDSNRLIKWQKRYGTAGSEGISTDTELKSGFLVAGGSANSDVWIMRLDSDGNKLTEYKHGGSGIDAIDDQMRLFPSANNLFTLSDWSNSSDGEVGMNHGNGLIDYWFLTIDTDGKLINSIVAGGTLDDNPNSNIVIHNNVAWIGGRTNSTDYDIIDFHGGLSDGYLVRVEQFDFVETIAENHNQIIIYPNPVHENAVIKMSWAVLAQSKLLEVFDAQGKLIHYFSVSKNNNQFSAGTFGCGMFLYRLVGRSGEILGSGSFLVQ